jgi:hypothetical protein
MMKKYSEKVKCGEKLKFIAVYMALCYGKCWSKLLLTKQTFDWFFLNPVT